jgi:hypothetical protein
MNEINEEEILATLYLNLKGPKKKRNNWIEIAYKCKQLADYYGSAKKVAEKLGVHYEIIRSAIKLLTLPEEIRQLIERNEILFDVGQRIARIKNKEVQIKVARAVIGMSNHDAREVIQYAKKYPDAPLDDFKNRVMHSKDKVEKVNLVIVPMKEEMFELLKEIGKKDKLSPEKVILNIVSQWMKNHSYGGDLV